MDAQPAQEMMAFSVSLSYDQRLAPDDITASIAHVRGLGRGAILTADEVATLVATLQTVGVELASNTFAFEESDEDIHTAIERRVTELAGPTGAKLHTGRSRNDQVATALRLFTRRHLVSVAKELLAFQEVLLERAQLAGTAYLPGYTHLQRAQPVTAAHWFLAHAWTLARDVDRLLATRDRLNVSPLGAGALGGSSLALDPDGVADELEFAHRFNNSLDAVSDRDFVAESLFDLALIGVHCSRIGEEIVLYSSEEFGFFRLDDSWSTGSSMLPQKKNPDIGELARGKSGRLIGNLTGFLATLKGLPLAYNRDLQEDKEPLFDALDQILLALPALAGVIRTIRLDTERMAAAADQAELKAIDLAEFLVQRGMPFRSAHSLVGELVHRSMAGEALLVDLVANHEAFGDEAAALFAPGHSLVIRKTPGGGGNDAVAVQIDEFVVQLASDHARVDILTV